MPSNLVAEHQAIPAPATSRIRIAVVVANYNSPADTDLCIRSIEEASKSNIVPIVIVVDNSDTSPDYLHPGAVVLRPKGNVGLGGAWAIGYTAAEAEHAKYCMFLNNDAVLDPSFFAELSSGIANHGPLAVLGPRIVRADGSGRVWSRGGSISVWRASVRHFGGQENATLPKQDFETGHLSGCCIAAPIELLRRIGGPDDRFFFRGEEWDLNHRLSQAGGRLVLCDHASVAHAVGRSHDRFSPRMLYFAYRAKVLFARKHQPAVWFPFWFVLGVAYAALIAPIKFLVFSRHRNGHPDLLPMQRALLRAFADGLVKDRIDGGDYPSPH